MATAPVLTVDCWRVDVSGVSDAAEAKWDAAEPEQRERAAQLAVAALRFMTGGAVEPCAYVVRPCARPCTPVTWQTYPVAGPGAGGFMPRLDAGQWINVQCGACGADSGCCGHSGASIRLPEATQIVSVWLNGEALDESAYELRAGMLYQTSGAAWPRCQDLDADRTADATFEVTYYRRRPGSTGERAAGALACEYLVLFAGGKCALPSSATQVTRNGVSVTLTPGAFPAGLTGVRDVDAWVQSVNPHKLTAPSAVVSPDMIR